jgi:predicted DCC family thiol-disulfide oxidoreductase YuxK
MTSEECMYSISQPLFLFDGDCGVCQNGTASMRRRFDPPVDMSAYQCVDLSAYGITDDEVLEGPVLVRVNGSHVVGPLAIAEMLRISRRPYRTLGVAMLLPGVSQLLHSIGPSVYRQRHRLPGASETCRIPTGEGH